MLTSISSLCRIWDEERTYETPADVFTAVANIALNRQSLVVKSRIYLL